MISPAQTASSLELSAALLSADIATRLDQDLAPFYLSRADRSAGGVPVAASFSVLYVSRPEGLEVLEASELATGAFKQIDGVRRQTGYHLVSATPYADPSGSTLWAGIWHRYAPLMRTSETEFDELVYAEDKAVIWDYFDGQIVELMSGDQADTRAVPSCTFAALEGAELVYQKSYTFGPSIYPQTQHDHAFALASASKSYTAGALVKAFDEAGLDLDTPLVEVLEWDGGLFSAQYAGFAEVSVCEVLQQIGGIRTPGEYMNHEALIANLVNVDPGAQLPVTLEDHARWTRAILEGAIQADAVVWTDTPLDIFRYENQNYTLLGAALSQVAGEDLASYRPYIETLAETVGTPSVQPLHETLLPFAAQYQPMRSLKRSFLSLGLHPFQQGEAPGFGFSPVPYYTGSPSDAPPWTPTVNTLDQGPAPQLPSWTGLARYGGRASMMYALLSAGGWEGAAVDALRLLRAFTPNDPNQLLDPTAAKQLWDPSADIVGTAAFAEARYGLGVYLYKNWMMAAGGNFGGMSLLLHNLEHDVSYAVLCNVNGNGFSEFIDSADLDGFELDSQGLDLYPCVDWTTNSDPELAVAGWDECVDFD
jgi:CubicO group peptidase (beta-lactamase class C family)